jgi:asparagine synthase (glutamine-hydrolysing)
MIAGADDMLDKLDFLYIEEYLPYRLLTWREYYAARGFAVQQPLLDNDLLDFTRKLPPDLRREKRLYVDAATALDPDLFAVPRAAASGCVIDWRGELQRRAASLAASCVRSESSRGSLLDDVIDPRVVAATLDLPQLRNDEPPRGDATRRVLRREWRRVRRKLSGRQLPIRVGPVEFLLRYLVLRRFLEVSGPDSLLTRLQAAGETAHRPLLP